MTAALLVKGEDLERGNEPLLEHAATLLTPDVDQVTFTVAYHRPHAKPGEAEWSSVDVVTVTRDGEVSGAPAAE